MVIVEPLEPKGTGKQMSASRSCRTAAFSRAFASMPLLCIFVSASAICAAQGRTRPPRTLPALPPSMQALGPAARTAPARIGPAASRRRRPWRRRRAARQRRAAGRAGEASNECARTGRCWRCWRVSTANEAVRRRNDGGDDGSAAATVHSGRCTRGAALGALLWRRVGDGAESATAALRRRPNGATTIQRRRCDGHAPKTDGRRRRCAGGGALAARCRRRRRRRDTGKSACQCDGGDPGGQLRP